MKVVLDTSVLVFLINPGASPPLDPATGECVTHFLAIARVAGASKILTDDENLRKRASRLGMSTLGIADIPIADSKRQTHLFTGPVMAADDAATYGEQAPS